MKMLVKTSDMSDNTYELITQLTQIRCNNNLTQKDLAKLCNTEQEVISRMESGINSPLLKNVCKIANALGFDLVLLSKKERNNKATKYRKKAVERKKVIATIKEVYKKMYDSKDIDNFKAILIEAIKVLPPYKEESK